MRVAGRLLLLCSTLRATENPSQSFRGCDGIVGHLLRTCLRGRTSCGPPLGPPEYCRAAFGDDTVLREGTPLDSIPERKPPNSRNTDHRNLIFGGPKQGLFLDDADTKQIGAFCTHLESERHQ